MHSGNIGQKQRFCVAFGMLVYINILHNLKKVIFNAAFQRKFCCLFDMLPHPYGARFSAGTQESAFRFAFYFALFCHCCLNNFPSPSLLWFVLFLSPQDEQMHVNVLWKWKDKEQPKLQACHLLPHILLRFVSVLQQ